MPSEWGSICKVFFPSLSPIYANIPTKRKIKRIIFETMSKWDGWMEVPLEVSQVKQIAGRAGRYGMGVESGVVTTLDPSDLLLLSAAMESKQEPLRYARVGFISNRIMDIFEALPRGSTATTVRDALLYCSALHPSMAVMDPNAKEAETMRYVDSFSQDLSFTERALMLHCPFPSMDDQCKAIMGQVLSTYRNKFSVDLRKILLDSGLLVTLEQVLALKRTKTVLTKPKRDLASLETLHSVLTIYAWLSLRNSIAFNAYDQAVALRKATQEAMDYCLRSFSMSSLVRRPERTMGFRAHLMHRPLISQASHLPLQCIKLSADRLAILYRNCPGPRYRNIASALKDVQNGCPASDPNRVNCIILFRHLCSIALALAAYIYSRALDQILYTCSSLGNLLSIQCHRMPDDAINDPASHYSGPQRTRQD